MKNQEDTLMNRLLKENHDQFHAIKKLQKDLARAILIADGLRATLTANAKINK